MSQLDAETPRIVLSHNRYCQAFETMAGGFATLRSYHGGQFMIPGVGPAVALQNAPQHAQIGTALGAIHAKDCAKWCGIGNGRRVSIG